MNLFKINNALILATGLLAFSSCKSIKPAEQAKGITPPSEFPSASDSTGIGAIKWNRFFLDDKLVALIDTALTNNLDLKMAIQRIEMANSSVLFRKGALLPNVSAEIAGGGNKYGDYTMDGVGNYDTNFSPNLDSDRKLPAPFMPNYFVGLKTSWEIDIWGKLKTQKNAAYTRFLASQKVKQAITTGLIAQVSSLYYEITALDAELSIIHKNVELQQKAVSTILIQKEAGRANELAVNQFEAQLLNTKSLEINILQLIKEKENDLNLLLGRFPQTIDRNSSLKQQLPESLNAGIPSELLRRRPDIQQAELELLANYSDQHAAKLAFLPSLNITAMLGFNSFKSSLLLNTASVAYNAIGGLTAPLFNRKSLHADQNRAIAASKESLFAYNKSVLTGFQEVSTSLQKIENTRKIIDLKNQEVAVLQQAVATSQDLFLGGYASYLEIITAQKSVLEAELTLIEVQRDQLLAQIQLYRSLGGGWE